MGHDTPVYKICIDYSEQTETTKINTHQNMLACIMFFKRNFAKGKTSKKCANNWYGSNTPYGFVFE